MSQVITIKYVQNQNPNHKLMQTNWELFQKQNKKTAQRKVHKPTLRQRKQQQQYEKEKMERQKLFRQKTQKQKHEVPQQGIEKMGLFNFQPADTYLQNTRGTKYEPIIVSSIIIELENLHGKDTHQFVAYLSLYNSKTDKILYQTYIRPNLNKYRIKSLQKNAYNLQHDKIINGQLHEQVQNDLQKIVNTEDYYVGIGVKKLFQNFFKQNTLSSHLCDISLAFDNTESYTEIVFKSGLHLTSVVNPDEMHMQQKQIWDKIKYRYDILVAEYYKNKQIK